MVNRGPARAERGCQATPVILTTEDEIEMKMSADRPTAQGPLADDRLVRAA